MNNSEICIPAAALNSDTEDGGSVAPQQGDPVTVSIEGKVTRIEGGNVYIMPESANGQPLEGAGEMSLDEEGEAIDRELAGYNEGGLLGLIVAFLLFFSCWTASAAQPEGFARRVSSSSGSVSNFVVFSGPTQAFQVEINNYGSVTNYCLIFDSSTNSLAGRVPDIAAVAIPPGKTGGKNWGPSGCPFAYGVNVCLSTTPFSLTNAASGGTATLYHRGQP